jgi:hypothetical protein
MAFSRESFFAGASRILRFFRYRFPRKSADIGVRAVRRDARRPATTLFSRQSRIWKAYFLTHMPIIRTGIISVFSFRQGGAPHLPAFKGTPEKKFLTNCPHN